MKKFMPKDIAQPGTCCGRTINDASYSKIAVDVVPGNAAVAAAAKNAEAACLEMAVLFISLAVPRKIVLTKSAMYHGGFGSSCDV